MQSSDTISPGIGPRVEQEKESPRERARLVIEQMFEEAFTKSLRGPGHEEECMTRFFSAFATEMRGDGDPVILARVFWGELYEAPFFKMYRRRATPTGPSYRRRRRGARGPSGPQTPESTAERPQTGPETPQTAPEPRESVVIAVHARALLDRKYINGQPARLVAVGEVREWAKQHGIDSRFYLLATEQVPEDRYHLALGDVITDEHAENCMAIAMRELA